MHTVIVASHISGYHLSTHLRFSELRSTYFYFYFQLIFLLVHYNRNDRHQVFY